MDDSDNITMLDTAAIPSSSTEQNKGLDLLLLDSALTEYLLDINTGITYRLVDLNGGSSLFTPQDSNAGYTSSLLVDHEPSSISTHFLSLPSGITPASSASTHHPSLSSQNPTLSIQHPTISNQIHSIPSLSQHQMLRSVSGVVEDSELDEIISVVKEDMTHDEAMIETCGKLPPVRSEHILYRRLSATDQNVHTKSSDTQTSHYNPDFRPDTVGVSRSAGHKKFSLVAEDFNLAPTIKEEIGNLVGDDSQVLLTCGSEEDFRKITSSDEASRLASELNLVSCNMAVTKLKTELSDDNEESPLILTSATASSNALCKVDEDISLEDREAMMQSVKDQLRERRKPESSNRPVFEGERDKMVVYICNLCGQVFEQLSYYHGHLRKHTEEFVWKCTQCSPEDSTSTFRTQSLLKAHVRRTHSAARAYTCELCADAFLFPSHLFSHLRAVHQCERDLACPLCPKRQHAGPAHYPSLDIAPSDPLSRSVLDKSWSLAQLKAQVDNLTRENADLKRRLESGALVFDRYRADMRRQIDALRGQLDELTQKRDARNNAHAESDGNSTGNEGSEMGSLYEDGKPEIGKPGGDVGNETSGEDAKKHSVAKNAGANFTGPNENVEVNRGPDATLVKKQRNHLTICEHIFCKDFLFYKKCDLISHLSVHLQLKRHLCELCGKGFSHSSNLHVHRRSHTGSRPYPCVHCGRRFRQINALNIHTANHFSSQSRHPSTSQPTSEAASSKQEVVTSVSNTSATPLSTASAITLSDTSATTLSTRSATVRPTSQSSRTTDLPKDQSASNNHAPSASPNSESPVGSSEELDSKNDVVQSTNCEDKLSIVSRPITDSGETESTPQSFIQSTNQPIAQSTNPSITQSTNLSITQSTNHSITQSTNTSITQSTNQSVAPSTNSSMPESTEHLISLRENGRVPKKFYCLVCGQTFRYRLMLRRHMSELHETQKLFQCSECVQIYHHVYDFLSHSCISGDLDRAGSAPDLIADHSEELISLLSEILNSCHPGGGANRNEELMSILMNLNVGEERGGGGGKETGRGGEGGGVKLQVKEEPEVPAELDHEIDMSSGEISAEQIFRNISSSTLSSLKNPSTNSVPLTHAVQNNSVPLTHTVQNNSVPLPTSSVPTLMPSENTSTPSLSLSNSSFCSTSSNPNTSNSLVSNSSSSIPMDTSSTQVSSLPSSVPACPAPLYTKQAVHNETHIPANGNPSRLCVSLSTVERLKKMLSLGRRNKETLARIVDRLKRHTGDKLNAPQPPPPSSPPSLPPPSPAVTPPPTRKKTHFCPGCQAGFTRRASLRVHLSSVHKCCGNRPAHACKLCPAVFTSAPGLTNHVRRTHEDSQRFPCDDTSEGQCRRDFATRHKLQIHKQRDHGKVRPHACDQCGKRFFSLYDLKVHGLVHTGEKPYACSLCPQTFRHSSHLLRHRRCVHRVNTA